MLTCAPHPSYPGHCVCMNGMSGGLGDDKLPDNSIRMLMVLSLLAKAVESRFTKRWHCPASAPSAEIYVPSAIVNTMI